MRLIEMAEKVLRAVGEPMHSREIIEYGRAKGWLSSRSRTPDHSLQAAIWVDINENGASSRFRMVGKVRQNRKYWLRKSRGN